VHHENVNAGTVTVESFGLEAWDYEEAYHPRETTIRVNYAEIPLIPAKKLLRRCRELVTDGQKFGCNPRVDLRDLKEFTRGMGYVPLITLREALSINQRTGLNTSTHYTSYETLLRARDSSAYSIAKM
jgi:hypothetical protein